MNFKLKKISILICLILSQEAFTFELKNDYKSKWAGIEVIGSPRGSAHKIRELLPIRIGETFIAANAKHYKNLCHDILRKSTTFNESNCSILWYGDETAYLVVDLLDKNANNTFREIPKTSITPKIPKNLNALYKKWNDHASALMTKGDFPIENFDNGFRDFENPVLHNYALELKEIATKHNNILLNVVHYSTDNIERQKAADLLSWGKIVDNIHFIIDWSLLTDPDPTVRNNIARSFLHFVHQIEDELLLKNLLQAYCAQATLPTHGDRNKALYSIQEILEKHPKLISAINSECSSNISYLSEVSILENIQEPAKDILAILAKK
jgi:hypothetical protein